ncbi:MAG: low-specificity L-threonine aldolase [Desulfuromonadaceae bacterium]|nr:low-specificity L-threonine aldolase [Desulfuromonadaceae bacterium]
MIDLRSDTVTLPTREMRQAMAAAAVGDDVYGEDPTVNRLEDLSADMLGFEAALFLCTGTQSNLAALMSHCERGDEYLVGQQAHTYKYEGGGAAVLGSIQPQPLEFAADGTIDLDKAAQAVKADDVHFAKTRLFCLENTQGGKALPLDYLARAEEFARSRNLALHLDGARIFNAAVAKGVGARDIARHFDSVSVCLSKGLGAPVGSVLCGSRSFIDKARRWRKVLGGGMRQAGVLAAAGIVALTSMVERLKEDHDNAARLAAGLTRIGEGLLRVEEVNTNMVFVSLTTGAAGELAAYLKGRGMLVTPAPRMRLVTHKDVDAGKIDAFVEAVTEFRKDFLERRL